MSTVPVQGLPAEVDAAVAVAREGLARASLAGRSPTHFAAMSDEPLLRTALAQADLEVLQGLAGWFRDHASDSGHRVTALSSACFDIRKALPVAADAFQRVKDDLRLVAAGMLANRAADVRRSLGAGELSAQVAARTLSDDPTWAQRLFLAIADAMLRVARKQGWEDLDAVSARIKELREAQGALERDYLRAHNGVRQAAALELVALYHVAKAVETLALYVGTGEPTTASDVVDLHFRKAISAADAAGIAELSVLLTWLHAGCRSTARATIWHQLAAYNSKITNFKSQMVSRENCSPMFELLPPQREALKEVMNIGNRALVVELPTSGGKTLLSEFRIIQTKVNFPDAWIAYLVPTRALINQVSRRLRRDLGPLGIRVEQATPALEIDIFEDELVENLDEFDVLVTTPEKLDLMIRSSAVDLDSRTLGLVVLDEAHNIGDGDRGLRSELLLATINRESPDSHFLLLSPFVPNAEDLGTWLDAERSRPVRPDIALNWTPNDRVVGLVFPEGQRRDWGLRVRSLHTTKSTLDFEGSVEVGPQADQAEPISKIKAKNKIAARAARSLCVRDGTIVLAYSPSDTWSVAREIAEGLDAAPESHLRGLVQRYIKSECGNDFELVHLLDKGVAVHHAGLSPETRFLLEVLAEEDELRALVATTTLAQGVNFPIANVVLATHYKAKRAGPDRWFKQPLEPQEFWNIAGRAGRLWQDSLGVVLLASLTSDDVTLTDFVTSNVRQLASALEQMVRETLELGRELDLHRLVKRDPRWSSFVQFLSHAYREIGDHDQFLAETEMLLQRTLAYHRLSRDEPVLAERLLDAAVEYAGHLEKMSPGIATLVDSTGFSPESVASLLAKKGDYTLSAAEWSPSSLFQAGGSPGLNSLIGALLSVGEVGLDPRGKGDATLAQILGEWVQGVPLDAIANRYFDHEEDASTRLTECARLIFQRLAHQASWGVGALQHIAGPDYSKLSKQAQDEIRTLPSMLFYGTSSVEGVLMRSIGVPRTVAEAMGRSFVAAEGEGEHPRRQRARTWLSEAHAKTWQAARKPGDPMTGADYKELWSLLAT